MIAAEGEQKASRALREASEVFFSKIIIMINMNIMIVFCRKRFMIITIDNDHN